MSLNRLQQRRSERHRAATSQPDLGQETSTAAEGPVRTAQQCLAQRIHRFTPLRLSPALHRSAELLYRAYPVSEMPTDSVQSGKAAEASKARMRKSGRTLPLPWQATVPPRRASASNPLMRPPHYT